MDPLLRHGRFPDAPHVFELGAPVSPRLAIASKIVVSERARSAAG